MYAIANKYKNHTKCFTIKYLDGINRITKSNTKMFIIARIYSEEFIFSGSIVIKNQIETKANSTYN